MTGSLDSLFMSTEIRRLEDLAWDGMPAVGDEQFWRPATQRLSFRRQLELRAAVKQLYERSRQRRPRRHR